MIEIDGGKIMMNKEKDIIILDAYIIHIIYGDYCKFIVCPIVHCGKLVAEKFSKTHISYYNKDMQLDDDIREFDEDNCQISCSGTFCWRGVWESRLYFESDEYWGEELKELSDIFSNIITPCCKDYLRKTHNIIEQ